MSKTSVLKHVFTVGGFTAFSRVLGLLREMLQARLIGAGVEQSAFTLAFAIPNMARKLFGEGALTAAFVPVFRGAVEGGEIEAAKRLARAVVTTMMLILGAVVALAVVALTVIIHFRSSFFGLQLAPRVVLILKLVRILFPYMVFICGAAFGMGVLNALGRFVEGAFMPAFLNLIWIAALGALCFLPSFSLAARVTLVAWAILIGGALQMAFLFRCLQRRGYGKLFSLASLSFLGDVRSRLVWRNTMIAAMGAGAVQINYMLDQVWAQVAAPWAAGVIGYAERLMDLPLGIVGVAFGTVLLPTFSGYFARADQAGARQAFAQSLRNMLSLMIPAAVGIGLLAEEVTRVIYEGGSFDAMATLRVSRALAVYALGLGCFGFQKTLIPWFQAQNDMKTPLRVSAITVAVNAGLNALAVVALPIEWRHVGLAASTVVCAALGCWLLLAAGWRKNGSLGIALAVPAILKAIFSSLVMAGCIWWLRPRVAEFPPVVALAILVGAGAAVYFALMGALGKLGRSAK